MENKVQTRKTKKLERFLKGLNTRRIKIDPNEFNGSDIPGFALENSVRGITVRTWRADWQTGIHHKPKSHCYYISVYPTKLNVQPKDVIEHDLTYNFNLAIEKHFAAVDYLNHKLKTSI